MDKEKIINEFLNDICAQFPEVAQRMATHDPEMTTYKMEEFSRLTTEAIANKQEEKAKKYLSYISKKLEKADDIEREYIDVYYVETLLFEESKEVKKYGWPLIPDNLKELYKKFWGKPAF